MSNNQINPDDEFFIPQWIASRVYRAKSGEVRAAIANELNHEFIVLDNESANFWDALVKRSEFTIKQISSDIRCSWTDAEEFFHELHSINLISKHNSIASINSLQLKSEPAENRLPSIRGPNEPAPGGDDTEAEYEFQNWTSERGFLWSASWEITYRCNESCLHCFNPGASHAVGQKSSRKTDELKGSEWKDMLLQLKQLGVFRLLLTGGEVLLHKEFSNN